MNRSPEEPAPPAPGEDDLVRNRRENFRRLSESGGAAPLYRYPATATVSDVVDRYGARSAEELQSAPATESAAGRVLAQRLQGKAGFLDLSDGRNRVQVYVRRDAVGDEGFELYRRLDLGDWIGVEGEVFRTRTGELSLKAHRLTFLARRAPRSCASSAGSWTPADSSRSRPR